MKDFDNIEDWYREELSNYKVNPDKEVWQSLSDELDATTPLTKENIGEWYKKEVGKLEERPDYTVWEKLSTKLDTASVWDKLVVSLNRYDQFIWWRNLAFRGSAVFLLLLGSYMAYNNYSSSSEINLISENVEDKGLGNDELNSSSNNSSDAVNEKDDSANNNFSDNRHSNPEDAIAIDQASLPGNGISGDEKVNQAIKRAKRSLYASSNNEKDGDMDKTFASKNDNEIFFSAKNISSLSDLSSENERPIFTEMDRHRIDERDISHLYASGDFLVKKEKNKIVFNSKRFSSYFMFGLYAKRIYLGVNTGFKKQGMITMINKSNELSRYTRTDYLDFGSNFGATVGYIISDNFNLETDINFNSTSGYKRAYSLEGLSYKQNLNLNYTSISVLAKKMDTKSTFDNKVYSTNLIAGLYAGYLTSATSDVNGVSQKSNEFNKTDLGIVLGIEQDRYLSKSWIITPGVRYNQGLLDIANDNSAFNSSRNFSFEFNLGVKYIFLKKSK